VSKGSGRRPQLADEKEVAARWEAIFGRPSQKAAEPEAELVGPDEVSEKRNE
jgi:hypothetical protein